MVAADGDTAESVPAAPAAKSSELDALKEQMADMQKKIEAMAKK